MAVMDMCPRKCRHIKYDGAAIKAIEITAKPKADHRTGPRYGSYCSRHKEYLWMNWGRGFYRLVKCRKLTQGLWARFVIVSFVKWGGNYTLAQMKDFIEDQKGQ